MGHKGFQHATYFRNTLSQKKNQNIRVLPLPLCLDNAVPAQRLRLPAITEAAIRDPFISPAHHTKPERWPLPEGQYTVWLIASCRIF